MAQERPAAKAICSVPDCPRMSFVRGWCNAHYIRMERFGSPTAGGKYRDRRPLVERYWARVDMSAGLDECWPWTGEMRPDGYGRLQPHRAHRLGYELQVGPIPDGLVIDHLCRNRACQNARHMEPVTIGENVRRGEAWKVNAMKTDCPHGHPYAGDNLYIDSRGHRRCRVCINKRYTRKGDS